MHGCYKQLAFRWNHWMQKLSTMAFFSQVTTTWNYSHTETSYRDQLTCFLPVTQLYTIKLPSSSAVYKKLVSFLKINLASCSPVYNKCVDFPGHWWIFIGMHGPFNSSFSICESVCPSGIIGPCHSKYKAVKIMVEGNWFCLANTPSKHLALENWSLEKETKCS